jgi:hypothetical protein
MRILPRILRDRLVPAILTAAGVMALAAGLLQYSVPAQAGPAPGASIDEAATPIVILPTLPPIDSSPPPSIVDSPAPGAVATRIVIETLGVDLPVIAQPDAGYPPCNVAMDLQHPGLGQPGGGRSIYIYAHARTGMFGPLYERAILNQHGGAKSLIDLAVSVYTGNDLRYLYVITRVIPNVKADSHFLDAALAATSETLWLQTSTGPNATFDKLQVVAEPVLVVQADHAAAHPVPHPINCAA